MSPLCAHWPGAWGRSQMCGDLTVPAAAVAPWSPLRFLLELIVDGACALRFVFFSFQQRH